MKVIIISALATCALIALVQGEGCLYADDCRETQCAHLDHHVSCVYPTTKCESNNNQQCHGECSCVRTSACNANHDDCAHVNCGDNNKQIHCVDGAFGGATCHCVEFDN